MEKAKEAKEKLQAVLNAESDHTSKHGGKKLYIIWVANFRFAGRTNRIGTTSHPSSGTCEVVNNVDHAPRENTSGIKGVVEKVTSRPAY